MSAPAETLTKREREVATAYADGKSYRTIADDFHISPDTVRTHLRTIYRKLGVRSKLELLDHVGQRGAGGMLSARQLGDGRPSVVVLPFENRSGNIAEQALIDGLVERVTVTLSRADILMMIAAATGLTYRGTDRSPVAIGRELGVSYVLRGAFHRDARKLRISAELIETSTSLQIWGEVFDGAWGDIFVMQDEVAAAIAQSIVPRIRKREIENANRRPTNDLTAWELYCRSYHSALQFSRDGYRQAQAYAQQAIEADRDFAAPHAMLGRINFMQMFMFDLQNAEDLVQQGLVNCREALARDDMSETAYCGLVCTLSMIGAHDEAFAASERAIAINPNDSEVYNARAFAHANALSGDSRLVVSDSRNALRISPNDPMRWTFLSNIGLAQLADDQAGDLEMAFESFRDAALSPRAAWIPSAGAALAALEMGNPAGFDTHLTLARSVRPNLTAQDSYKAFGHAMRKSERVRRLIGELARHLPAA